jgi:uncharacterized protein YraI
MKDNLKTLRITQSNIVALVLAFGLILSACNNGAAKPTDVKISAPTPGTVINVGQGTVIQGEANGDNITRVEVVIDGKPYASLSTPDKTKGVPNFPVSVPWTPTSAGTHALQLRAFGIDDKLLGQSEPLVMDAKASVAQVTPTGLAAPTVGVSTPTVSAAQGQGAATAAPQATSASSSGPQLTVNNDFVNVREGPNIGYRLLGRLDKGATAPVRGKSQDGTWWQISYASGTNGVGWVISDYVQANSAASSVPIASAPPLPTQPPPPPEPVIIQTLPPPAVVVIAPTPIPVSTGPLVGTAGQLRVTQNPIPQNGTITAYWNVSNIAAIFFDSGDGGGFKPASGSQQVNITNVTAQRLIQLQWRDNSGNTTTDQLTVYMNGQVVAGATNVPQVSQTCSASDPNWRGANSNYPFCVAQDLDWSDGASPVRYFSQGQDVWISMRWSVYGIKGIWLEFDPNSNQCGPAANGNREVPVSGTGTYSFHVSEFPYGGYIVHLKVQRNDDVIVYHNEKFMCIGTYTVQPTANPNPPTRTVTPVPTPVPVASPTAKPTPKP